MSQRIRAKQIERVIHDAPELFAVVKELMEYEFLIYGLEKCLEFCAKLVNAYRFWLIAKKIQKGYTNTLRFKRGVLPKKEIWTIIIKEREKEPRK